VVLDRPSVLVWIDVAISTIAVAMLTVIAARWLLRRGRHLFATAPPRPNSLREDSLALAVLVYLAALLLLMSVVRLATGSPGGGLWDLAIGNGAQLAGAAACLYIASERFGGGVPAFLRAGVGAHWGRDVGVTMTVTVLALGLCPFVLFLTEAVVVWFAPNVEFPRHPTMERLSGGGLPVWVVAAMWLSAVLVAPVAEELFFRGIVQTLLLNVLRRRWPAILVASFVFAMVHFPQPQAMPALAVLGVLLGLAYERTGSLLPAIAVHAVFNLKTLIWDSLGVVSG
jgi:membrane protease YdiL (CAAX protease family)